MTCISTQESVGQDDPHWLCHTLWTSQLKTVGPTRAPKKYFLLKIFIRWFVFVEKKILISLNSLIWKTKSTNKYWFENPSTNSTNQRIKFSLICKNVNEFSTKIPINPPNFQRIMRNQWQFSKHRPISNKISTNSKIFWEFSLLRWNFRWKFVEIL